MEGGLLHTRSLGCTFCCPKLAPHPVFNGTANVEDDPGPGRRGRSPPPPPRGGPGGGGGGVGQAAEPWAAAGSIFSLLEEARQLDSGKKVRKERQCMVNICKGGGRAQQDSRGVGRGDATRCCCGRANSRDSGVWYNGAALSLCAYACASRPRATRSRRVPAADPAGTGQRPAGRTSGETTGTGSGTEIGTTGNGIGQGKSRRNGQETRIATAAPRQGPRSGRHAHQSAPQGRPMRCLRRRPGRAMGTATGCTAAEAGKMIAEAVTGMQGEGRGWGGTAGATGPGSGSGAGRTLVSGTRAGGETRRRRGGGAAEAGAGAGTGMSDVRAMRGGDETRGGGETATAAGTGTRTAGGTTSDVTMTGGDRASALSRKLLWVLSTKWGMASCVTVHCGGGCIKAQVLHCCQCRTLSVLCW